MWAALWRWKADVAEREAEALLEHELQCMERLMAQCGSLVPLEEQRRQAAEYAEGREREDLLMEMEHGLEPMVARAAATAWLREAEAARQRCVLWCASCPPPAAPVRPLPCQGAWIGQGVKTPTPKRFFCIRNLPWFPKG